MKVHTPSWCAAHLLPLSVCRCEDVEFVCRLKREPYLPKRWAREQVGAATIPTVSARATGPVEWSWGKTSNLVMGFDWLGVVPVVKGGAQSSDETAVKAFVDAAWAEPVVWLLPKDATPLEDIRQARQQLERECGIPARNLEEP